MGFNIGSAIEGAITGFLETGNPYAAGAMALIDGFSNSSQATNGDSMLQGGQNLSSLIDYAQFADAAS